LSTFTLFFPSLFPPCFSVVHQCSFVEIDALEETLFVGAPIDYDSDTAADEIPAKPQAKPRELGIRTVAEILKNALENRTNSKKALKEHQPQAKAPSTHDANQRWLNIFKSFMKTLGLP